MCRSFLSMFIISRELMFLMGVLFVSFQLYAQDRTINVGDKCPDVSVKAVNYKDSVLKISDFKGRLLILDFWATWCKPCVYEIPRIDSLQKEFEDKIQILPVSYEERSKVSFLLEKVSKALKTNMPSVYGDTVLSKLFPHREIPHCVWIDKSGKVVSITDAHEITKNNIENVLKGELVKMPQHKDVIKNPGFIGFDKNLFYTFTKSYNRTAKDSENENVRDEDVKYKSMLTSYRDSYLRIQGFDSTRVSACNIGVQGLYCLAFLNRMVGVNNSPLNFESPGRVIWEVKDTSLLILTDSTNNSIAANNILDAIEWLKEYTFSYEVNTPKSWGPNKKYDIMLEDLNRYFGIAYGINGFWEKRKVKCIVLVRTSQKDKLKSRGGEGYHQYNPYYFKLRNYPLKELTMFIGSMFMVDSKYPMIDDTGYTEFVDLEVNCDLYDLKALNMELSRYDLRLVEKNEELDIIVLKQISKH